MLIQKSGTGKRRIATKNFRWKKFLVKKKIDWKKKIERSEHSDIREVKNESNFVGGITKKEDGMRKIDSLVRNRG